MYLEHEKLSRSAKFQKNFEQVSSNFTYPARGLQIPCYPKAKQVSA